MSGGNVDEVARLVSRRRALLDALAAGNTTKAELVDSLESSRSTIDRAVRELEGVELVARTHGRVELTLTGRLVLDAYRDFRDAAIGVEDARDLLTGLPEDAPLDPEFFQGARVVDADEASPYRPVSALEEVVRSADAIKSYSTSLVPSLLHTFVDGVCSGALRAEVVVTDTVLDTLVSEHTDALKSSLDSGNLTLYSRERCLPFEFLVADSDGEGRTGVVTAGDHGYAAIVENDREEAVAWLDDLFADVVSDADHVDQTLDTTAPDDAG